MLLPMLANGGWDLTLILLTWTIWRAPTNASKWRMGFNSAFKGLISLFRREMQPAGHKNMKCHMSDASQIFGICFMTFLYFFLPDISQILLLCVVEFLKLNFRFMTLLNIEISIRVTLLLGRNVV